MTGDLLLGIGAAHRACSLALIEGGAIVEATDDIIGRGHAERLMPMVADLLAGRRPDRIIVEVGPGSFTGIRIGIAAARALGLAWSAPVTGVSSMVLTAARARAEGATGPLLIALDGGRGEVFTQRFDDRTTPASDIAALPTSAVDFTGIAAMAGTGLASLAPPEGIAAFSPEPPRMRDLTALPAAQVALPPAPIYVRPPDAKPQGG
ncbi:MAG: tRNA (adenosine(37)-N6)-threonylcarbamoyltransferase complex dimerization subunit type 1 TsaB [Pacificimonas sp.]|nr:tRNA (adenosine(37)-N6)-threonylcarbamoyltransferase complex dimerization subunit type 1 TsaB [Pacificimonas sp.]